MGLLDQVLGQVPGGTQPAANPAALLAGPLQQLLSGGGLQALLSHLNANGLGAAVSSWVSTGQNQPVTGAQLQSALAGTDLVKKLEAQTGLSGDALHGALAQVLPHAIDQVTPNGVVPPQGSALPDLGGLLGKLFH